MPTIIAGKWSAIATEYCRIPALCCADLDESANIGKGGVNKNTGVSGALGAIGAYAPNFI